MNKYKEFITNTTILFIGKFATQFMSLLLLPLYTRYLVSADYGLVDLFQTYIMLFVPILTLRMDSVLFRFLIDKRDNTEEISKTISNVIFILLFGIITTIIIGIILLKFINMKYYVYVLINLIILMISNSLLQILRGLGKIKEYSIVSIITSFIILITNIYLIVYLHKGAESILIASIIANIFCIIYIIIKSNLFSLINLKKINKKELKIILKYSLPMIPNSLSWWIVNTSDRTIISLFLGVAYNGIYTISCKFSNLLNNIYSVFNMSWQETATLHINDDDKDIFFSNMINKLLMLFSSISILIMASLPLLYDLLIGTEYLSSYNFIPILLYANTWSVLESLIGAIYVALKKTKEIANTTILSAIINLIIHFCLIKYIGLYAACLSTLISYIVMTLYRYYDSRKYVNYQLDFKNITLYTIIFIISYVIYIINIFELNIVNLIVVLIYLLVINQNIIKDIIELIKRKIEK